jgi:arabinogalactan oligomer / maltooligosaccharide transport system substrate-binding protein
MKFTRMILIVFLLLITQAACFFTQTATPQVKDDSIGDIKKISSQVEAGPENNLKLVDPHATLLNNDSIRVSQGGKAELLIGNDILFTLYNDTQLNGIKSDGSKQVLGYLAQGGLKLFTPNGKKMEISLPGGNSIVILGTNAFVTYNVATGYTTAGNFDGTVQWVSSSGQDQSIQTGSMIDINPEGTITLETAIPFTLSEYDTASTESNSPIDGLNSLRKQYQIPLPGETITNKTMELTIWSDLPEDSTRVYEQIIKQYESDHPEVTVNWNRFSEKEFLDRFLLESASGNGPDILISGNNKIGSLATRASIVDLMNFGITRDYLIMNFEIPASNSVSWERGVWGIPLSEYGIALIYNNGLMTDDYWPLSNTDFEDLYEKAKTYLVAWDQDFKSPSHVLICNPGLIGRSGGAYYAAPIYFSFEPGLNGYIDEAGNVFVNTRGMISAGDWIAKFSSVSLPPSDSDCLSLFKEKFAAAIWMGPEVIPDIEAAGINYSIWGMGHPFVSTTAGMITTTALKNDKAKEALDLLLYFTSDASQMLMADNLLIPTSSQVINSAEFSKYYVPWSFAASLRNGVALSPSPFIEAQWEPLDTATWQIWTRELRSESALASAQKEIESRINQMR